MTLTAEPETEGTAATKPSKKPLIIGVVLAIIGGVGGFFATQMGALPFGPQKEGVVTESPDPASATTEDVAFVSLEPLTVSLPPGSDRRLLRLVAVLDVAPENVAAVEAVKPRILDILNTYLRALRVEDFEAPSALFRIRTHMLHRVQLVSGEGVVRDLLITEFVLN